MTFIRNIKTVPIHTLVSNEVPLKSKLIFHLTENCVEGANEGEVVHVQVREMVWENLFHRDTNVEYLALVLLISIIAVGLQKKIIIIIKKLFRCGYKFNISHQIFV